MSRPRKTRIEWRYQAASIARNVASSTRNAGSAPTTSAPKSVRTVSPDGRNATSIAGILPPCSAILDPVQDGQKEPRGMGAMRASKMVAVVALVLFCRLEAPQAQSRAEPALSCGHFTQDQLPAPEPREAAAARKRFEQINMAV